MDTARRLLYAVRFVVAGMARLGLVGFGKAGLANKNRAGLLFVVILPFFMCL
jgi:hypothetical protein